MHGVRWPSMLQLQLLLLPFFSIRRPFASAAAGDGSRCSLPTVRDCLVQAHFLLRTAEEIDRAYETTRNVKVLQVTTYNGRLCQKTLSTGSVSRKRYEDSWTSVYVAGSLQATYNGTCFTTSIDSCASYQRCADADPGDEYRQELDASGQWRYAPEPGAQESLHWAARQAHVQAWQQEQAQLLEQLASETDDSSETAQYIGKALDAAYGEVAKTLQLDSKSLVTIAEQRVQELEELVHVETAPAPAQGASSLPGSLHSLTAATGLLLGLASAEDPCSASHDWATLRRNVEVQLEQQTTVIAGIDSANLLQLASFDYTNRAVEAIVLATARALQAGILAAIAEFECLVKSSPRQAMLPDLQPLQEAAEALLQELGAALPLPADASAAAAPVQSCFGGRVRSASAAVAQDAVDSGSVSALLGPDLCKRLFDATANVVVEVSPFTEAIPQASSTFFRSSSDEERYVYYDTAGGTAYAAPYASLVERAFDGDAAYASGDRIIALKGVASDNVRIQAATPEATPDCFHLRTVPVECELATCADSCTCPTDGCYLTFQFDCLPAEVAYYASAGGQSQEICADFFALRDVAYFYAEGWHNSSCPFVCKHADMYKLGATCQTVDRGFYSPSCDNAAIECETPAGVPQASFSALARFTSSGHGLPDGCEVTLAFPMVSHAVEAYFAPPFTMEAHVKVAVDEIPQPAQEVPGLAIFFGVFPRWFVALRRASSGFVQVAFYHHRLTRTGSNRAESIVYSEPIEWSFVWHHIAVVASGSDASSPNLHFYADGELVSSARRSEQASNSAEPSVPPEQADMFHIGPPNMQLFRNDQGGVLTEGRTEPYFNLAAPDLFYPAYLDEVRVSHVALDVLSQGGKLTQLRRREVCDVPFEQLDGSLCRPVAWLTPAYAKADQLTCQEGYEPCGAQPGMCVAECAGGTLRQADCTCDCPSKMFQAWRLQAVRLLGSGSINAVKVYNTAHEVVAAADGGTLPLRLSLEQVAEVALVTVRGGGSASTVSLEVETPESEKKEVSELQKVAIYADRDSYLHHRRLHQFFDRSLVCSLCPGDVLGSSLPRIDALACLCANGDGRDLLGRCVPRKGALPSPIIALAAGSHTAGTLVRLETPEATVEEGSWLLEVRYEVSTDGSAIHPTCLESPLYTEEDNGNPVGLDIIRRLETVEVCAVLCHPLYEDSLSTCHEFTGNDHMNPPRLEVNGTLSTATTYAVEVTIAIIVDGQADAQIFYRLNDGDKQTYQEPIALSTPGKTKIQTWAEKVGFDASGDTVRWYSIDAEARLGLSLEWTAGATEVLGGFASSQGAHIVQRNVEKLDFQLQAQLPGGGAAPDAVETQYSVTRAAAADGSWPNVLQPMLDWTAVEEGSVVLQVLDLLAAAATTTAVHIEYRVREAGYVWSTPTGLNLLVIATRTQQPAIQASPAAPLWELGDQWFAGWERENALRQVHRIEIQRPRQDVDIYFVVGAWTSPTQLLEASTSDVSSLHNGGLTREFDAISSSGKGPEQLAEDCSTQLGALRPRVCFYNGPFEVMGGATITAFAMETSPGELESVAETLTVPHEAEPEADDLAFQVTVETEGPKIMVNQQPGLLLLSSAAVELSFTLDQEGAERQSCVLASHFSYGASSSDATTESFADKCEWLAYNGRRTIRLQDVLEDVGLDTDDSANITIFTTVRRPGYLWSFPRSVTFLWLRRRAPPPVVVSVQEDGIPPVKAGMVWLPEASHPVEAEAPSIYFTLHMMELLAPSLPANLLAEVKSQPALFEDVRDYMQPTDRSLGALAMAAWADDVSRCVWPDICKLPLNGMLPTNLIRVPADPRWLCAWVVWRGYRESEPACKDTAGENEEVEPTFGASGDAAGQVTSLGTDPVLGAQVVVFSSQGSSLGASRRLEALSLPVQLDQSHPLRHREASVAVDPESLAVSANQLVKDSDFSSWHSVNPLAISLPTRTRTDQHALLAIDVQLMTGVDSWGGESRSYVLVLVGRNTPVEALVAGRNVLVSTARPNSTIFYRWSLESLEVPMAADGGSISRLSSVYTSIAEAWDLHSSVQLMAQDVGTTTPEHCVMETVAKDAQGPRLCSVTSPFALAAPDSRRWVLWTAAFSPGLDLSEATVVDVKAQCLVPSNLLAGLAQGCAEGSAIDSGASCTPRCAAGYSPSVETLACSDGILMPASFTCTESSCEVFDNVTWAGSFPCAEGDVIPSGIFCTPQCLHGYEPSVKQILCRKGAFQPSTFECVPASCAAPSDVVHAAVPACSGVPVVASGGTCTPGCQDGFVPTEEALFCTKGEFTPASFACTKEEFSGEVDGVDLAPILASIAGGLVIVVCLGACAWCWGFGYKQKQQDEVEESKFSILEEWLTCVHEVNPGICVFCGKNPHSCTRQESEHGPATLFRCCTECLRLLPESENAPLQHRKSGGGSELSALHNEGAPYRNLLQHRDSHVEYHPGDPPRKSHEEPQGGGFRSSFQSGFQSGFNTPRSDAGNAAPHHDPERYGPSPNMVEVEPLEEDWIPLNPLPRRSTVGSSPCTIPALARDPDEDSDPGAHTDGSAFSPLATRSDDAYPFFRTGPRGRFDTPTSADDHAGGCTDDDAVALLHGAANAAESPADDGSRPASHASAPSRSNSSRGAGPSQPHESKGSRQDQDSDVAEETEHRDVDDVQEMQDNRPLGPSAVTIGKSQGSANGRRRRTGSNAPRPRRNRRGKQSEADGAV